MSIPVVVPPASRLVTLPEGDPGDHGYRTLGFEAFGWAVKYLKHPNGPRAGKRWEFVESQIRFLLWWYAVDDSGNWLYHHGVRRLAKGSGKSPIAALLALVEFCAPVRLLDFDDKAPGGCRGRPVAMPWVQIAATAESQTANTMRMVRAFAPKGSRVVADHGLDPGKTKYYKLPEGTLEVITSSSTAAEGAEGSFAVADEALALTTKIPTPEGWSTVGSIRVGDTIYGSSGPVTVTHVTPVFEGRPCYRVTFEDGTGLVADEGHLWQSKVVGSQAKSKVRTTREMAEDGRKFSVPRMTPFDGPNLDLPLDPYVLGAWLGDGTSRWAALTVADTDLNFMLDAVWGRGVPAAKATKYGERAVTVSLQGNAQGERYTKDGSSVRGALVKLGVLGDKHIPPALLRASLGQRQDLLRGLMDTDGWIGSSGAAVFVNANRRLVGGVAELVRTLGYTTHVTSRVDTRWPQKPTIYKVAFRPDRDRNPFLLPRKADKVKPTSRRRHKTITSIEPVASQSVKCIEVDAEDHLFVAGDGWTLTHNTEHWKPSNGGPDLMSTLIDNLTKSNSRLLETCNAWVPGEDSSAEDSYAAWLLQEEGRTRGDSKILYDARIAPPDTKLDEPKSLRDALRFVYDDCWWQDTEPIVGRIWSPKARPDEMRRKYLNQPTASSDSWVTPEQWAQLADPKREVKDGEEIVLFFDGSKSRDATALVGCCVEDGHIFTVGVWEPNPSHDSDETVDPGEVDKAVIETFDRYDVLAFFADVREWESYALTEWPNRYKDQLLEWAKPKARPPQAVAWDMRGQQATFAEAAEACHAEIVEAAFTHDGDSATSRHVGNARRRAYRDKWTIGKESPDSPRKIDAAVCVIGARMVRRLVLGSGKKRTPRTGRAAFL